MLIESVDPSVSNYPSIQCKMYTALYSPMGEKTENCIGKNGFLSSNKVRTLGILGYTAVENTYQKARKIRYLQI